MEVLETDSALHSSIEEFLFTNFELISATFQEHLLNCRSYFRQRGRLDLVKRLDDPATSLSEKPLCNVISLIPLPPNFHPIPPEKGRLEICPELLNRSRLPGIFAMQQSLSIPHCFAADDNDGVFCLTPAQWSEYLPFQNSDLPGERLNTMEHISPELVINLHGTGIGAIAGSRIQILQSLGLIYRW